MPSTTSGKETQGTTSGISPRPTPPPSPQPPPTPQPQHYIIDVAEKYGNITFDTLVKANKEGIAALKMHDYVTIKISAGTHVIDMTDDLFTVQGVQAKGELAVEGAGMNKTILLLNQRMNNMIKGKQFKNLAWRDLTFSHTTGQTTKGQVLAVGKKTMTIQVPIGFPSPRDILQYRYPRLRPSQGLYLLAYSTIAPGSPLTPIKITKYNDINHTVHTNLPTYNEHLPYLCSESSQPKVNGSSYVCDAVKDLGQNRWQFTLNPSQWDVVRPLYEKAVGNADVVVGIKAKRGGQAYALSDGDGVAFERVRWCGHSRGIIQDTTNVLFNGTNVSPMPPPVPGQGGYATATNGGGPQFKSCTVTVVGHKSQSSGDDSLAFFNIVTGSVTGCVINDGWGAGILLSNVSSAFVKNCHSNTVRRSPIYYPDKV
jgi:hypothetical protein